jgi:hypothetical protein
MQEELECEREVRVAMQEELRHEKDERAAECAAMQEERSIERAAMQEQLRLAVDAATAPAVTPADLAAPTPPPLQGTEPCAAAAAVATAPGRGFFDTQQSAGVRAADPKALVGKTIEVDGNLGAVKAVVGKAGGSTLHTVEFGSGKVENIHLAKRAGGKGTKFHIIAADE